jgi:parallel beta-helix repeat protein
MLTLTPTIQPVNAAAKTVYVDDDNILGPWDGTTLHPYQNITSGLEHATPGDTIYVYNGTYYEHVFIDKSISLVGENTFATIIDGGGEIVPLIHIFNVTDVIVRNFTVQNTTSFLESYGISLYQVNNVTIQNVVTKKCYYGVRFDNATNCKILDSKFANSYVAGIFLRYGNTYNYIIGNTIIDNPKGIFIADPSSENNIFYRNNLVNNTNQVDATFAGPTLWDNGVEGNYWSDYIGIDDGSNGRNAGDGIGDINLPHLDVEIFPLMEPWNKTRRYFVQPQYEVVIKCNYTVASFTYNQSLKQISFYITGPSGWSGYCNVTIPRELLSPKNASEKWMVMFGSTPLAYTNETINNSTLISFRYTLGSSMSENRVRLKVGVFYPPTADFEFTPSTPIVGELVTFNDTSVQGNGTIILRTWDFGDGVVENTTEQTINHTYTAFGNYTVKLIVIDSEGLTDSCSNPLKAIQYPIAVFTYSPTRPLANEPIVFNASNSTPEGGMIISYYWDFGDGTNKTVTNPTVSHTYRTFGTYTVSLSVVDNEGLNASFADIIKVLIPPTASFTYSPENPVINENVTFNASASFHPDPNGTITKYVWNFGDGITWNTTNPIVYHTFEHAGNYTVKLTVIDNNGLENSTVQTVNVAKGTTEVIIVAPTGVKAEDPFMVNATLRDYRDQPLVGEQIEFYIYDNGLVSSRISTTDNDGVARALFSLSVSGEYSIKVEYKGSGDYFGSNSTRFISVNLLDTSLTLQAPENVTQNEEFTMFATLLDENEKPVHNVNVKFYFYNGSMWEFLGAAKTNQSGVASFNYASQYTGTFSLKAVFDGTGTYAASNSSEQSLTVAASEIDYVPYIAYIVLVIIIVVAVYLVFLVLKRRRMSSNVRP